MLPLIIERKALAGVTPQIFNVELTEANTEYAFALPDGARSFLFKTRTPEHPLKVSFEQGKSGSVFMTFYKTGLSEENILARSQVLYFQSPISGCIVEVLIWF